MLDFDWYKVRFLESSGNLIPLVKARTGRTPSIQVAREIAACLQQGRQFYQSAIEAPIEIRPLLLFYGMTGFAKALVLADRVQSQSTLSQSHGLSDVSEAGCDIASLTLRVHGHGMFQAFNDVTKHLHRMRYRDRDTKPHTTWFTSSGSELLADLRVSLKEILARIPNLHILYSDTFNEPAGGVRLHSSVDLRESGFDHWTLAVSDREIFSDFDSLKAMVARWRERHTFLKRWRFQSARHFWDTSELQFENAHPTAMELDPANMPGQTGTPITHRRTVLTLKARYRQSSEVTSTIAIS